MGNTFEEIDREPPEPINPWIWGEDIDVEIWPAGGEFEVKLTFGIRRTRWWQWWRSDLPLPRANYKSIRDALVYSQSWLGSKKRCKFAPCYWELKVYFTKSD